MDGCNAAIVLFFMGKGRGEGGSCLPHHRPCRCPYHQSALRAASSLPNGKEPFGGTFPLLGNRQKRKDGNQRKTFCSGGRRNGAQPRCSPHRDGSGRRQIPRPFGRRGKGHTCYSQQTKKQPTYGGRPWIVPARRTKGQSKGFDQRERVAVFCLLFFKRVSAGCRGAQRPALSLAAALRDNSPSRSCQR